MNGYTRTGVILFGAASLVLIGSAVYVEHAFRHPESVIFPYPNTVAITPAIGPAPIAAVVALEQALVGLGLWCLRRGAKGRGWSSAA